MVADIIGANRLKRPGANVERHEGDIHPQIATLLH